MLATPKESLRCAASVSAARCVPCPSPVPAPSERWPGPGPGRGRIRFEDVGTDAELPPETAAIATTGPICEAAADAARLLFSRDSASTSTKATSAAETLTAAMREHVLHAERQPARRLCVTQARHRLVVTLGGVKPPSSSSETSAGTLPW
eukprot:scaffold22620_cov88-Isochrysis_galbana.AAC.1